MEAIDYSALPRRRLAQALRAAREAVGLDELAVADALGVSVRRLRALETGRRAPRESEVTALCGLYGLDLAGTLARRTPIVFDRDRGGIVVAGRLVRYTPGVTDNDAFLEAYVRVIRELRGVDDEVPLQLRSSDLAVLATVLDLDDADLEDRVAYWLGQPRGTQVGLRHRLILTAVVLGVAGSATVGGLIATGHAADAQGDQAGPAAVQQLDGPPDGHASDASGAGPSVEDGSGVEDAGVQIGDAAVDGGHHLVTEAAGGVGHAALGDLSTVTVEGADGATVSLDFGTLTGVTGPDPGAHTGGGSVGDGATHPVTPANDATPAPALDGAAPVSGAQSPGGADGAAPVSGAQSPGDADGAVVAMPRAVGDDAGVSVDVGLDAGTDGGDAGVSVDVGLDAGPDGDDYGVSESGDEPDETHSADFDGSRPWVRQVLDGQEVDGWTGDGVALTGSELWEASSGDTSVDMNGDGGPGRLHRTLDTEPGRTYEISFDLSGNPHGQRGIKTVEVSAGDDHASFAKDTRSISRDDMQWERVSMTFTADGPTTEIVIASTTPGAVGAVVDDISITPLT